MNGIGDYDSEDFYLIKGSLLILALSLVLAGTIFWGVHYIDNGAAAELQQARNQIDSIYSAMDQFKAQEGTVDKYLDKYVRLQRDGVIGVEDRLELLELLARIRSEHALFPLRIDIGEQAEFTLPYQSADGSTGRPISLRSSVLDINFPLLHEEDLSRLLDDLLGSSNLLQPASCMISANNKDNTNFYVLDEHFAASCSFYWYTFNITEAAEALP